MLGYDKIKKTSEGVRFASAAIMGIIVTIAITLIASPYYLAYYLIMNDETGGWWLLFGWTWMIFTFVFHLMIKWIDKGKEEGVDDKQIKKLTREN